MRTLLTTLTLNNIMEKFDAVVSMLQELSNSDTFALWNKMCEDTSNYDEYIEYMDSFNELFNGRDPLDIIAMANSDFSVNDDYFAFDRAGRLESFSYVEDYSCFDYSYIASHIIENGCDDDAIDLETLIETFVEEYSGYFPRGFDIRKALEEFDEENGFNILTDDWDELNEELHRFKNIEME